MKRALVMRRRGLHREPTSSGGSSTRDSWVRGVDLKRPEFGPSAADDFQLLDLREQGRVRGGIGGAIGRGRVRRGVPARGGHGRHGLHPFGECDIMRNNALININMIHAAAQAGIKTVFLLFVCVHLS